MGNGSKGGRASYATREKQMAAYDALPASVRKTLADGYGNWATYPIHQWWERGRFKDAASLVRLVKKWDADQAASDRAQLEKYLNRHDREIKSTPRRKIKRGARAGAS